MFVRQTLSKTHPRSYGFCKLAKYGTVNIAAALAKIKLKGLQEKWADYPTVFMHIATISICFRDAKWKTRIYLTIT